MVSGCRNGWQPDFLTIPVTFPVEENLFIDLIDVRLFRVASIMLHAQRGLDQGAF